MSCPVRLLLPVLALGAVPGAAAAQSGLDSACAASEHRQFDFWVGRWTVTDTAGREIGSNEITRIAGGCGLREHWTSARGGEGLSLNAWQPLLGVWTQFWVGSGVVLHLTGGLDDEGRMVMEGDRRMPNGDARDRITWEPLPSGAVRQSWDVSADGGETWRRLFEGIYRRASGSGDGDG